MTRDLTWLRESFAAVDRVYFDDECEAMGVSIRWMRWRPAATTFRFGLFRPSELKIEINQALAHEWVPTHVVLLTIFHEMLHGVLGNEHDQGFRAREQMFPRYAWCRDWEDENLQRLISATKPA